MRRLKVFSLLLSLIMLLTMFTFKAEAAGSGESLPSGGIWGNNVTLQGSNLTLESSITASSGLTLQASVEDSSQPSNITVGGDATVQGSTGSGTLSASDSITAIQNSTIGDRFRPRMVSPYKIVRLVALFRRIAARSPLSNPVLRER